jgi:TonB family protein
MHASRAFIRVTAALAGALLAACATTAFVPGPAGLDTTSSDAPRCGPQQYPFHALENMEKGTAVLDVTVDSAGAVQAAALTSPTASPFLNAAALDAARYCRFPAATAARHVRLVVAYDLASGDEHMPRGFVRIGLQH